MLATILKALATAGFIVLLSEVARRSTWLAAVMVALPLATMLTVAFIATDPTQGPAKANAFASSTFLLVWPGLVFFLTLPGVQRLGLGFWPAFATAVILTFAATWAFTELLKRFGVAF